MALGLPYRAEFLWFRAEGDSGSPTPAGNVSNPASKDALGPGTSSAGGRPQGWPGRPRRVWSYVAVAVVVAAVVIASALLLPGILRPSANGSTTLDPTGTLYTSLPYGQFAATIFNTGSSENISGGYQSTNTISVFVLTEDQFKPFVTTDNLSALQFEWTSGQVWNGTIHYTIPSAGNWVLTFVDTNRYGATEVLITQAVVLSPA
jgi:hypothetical protein